MAVVIILDTLHVTVDGVDQGDFIAVAQGGTVNQATAIRAAFQVWYDAKKAAAAQALANAAADAKDLLDRRRRKRLLQLQIDAIQAKYDAISDN